MTKIFIIGITGTLGHKIAQELLKNKNFTIQGTFTNKLKLNIIKKKFTKIKCHKIEKNADIIRLIRLRKFDYVINCAGIIKQKKQINKKVYSVNKILPLKISKLAERNFFKFIHFSTDCVFNGKDGNYLETQKPNAKDFYGVSKAEGEPSILNKQTITFRTSFIGHEIHGNYSLLDWFLNTKENINGYSKCYYNGLTTLEIAKFIKKNITHNLFTNGLFHLTGKKISKYYLIKKINIIYNTRKKISSISKPKINRTLNSNKLKKYFKYKTKSWDLLLKDLNKDYKNNKNLYVN